MRSQKSIIEALNDTVGVCVMDRGREGILIDDTIPIGRLPEVIAHLRELVELEELEELETPAPASTPPAISLETREHGERLYIQTLEDAILDAAISPILHAGAWGDPPGSLSSLAARILINRANNAGAHP